jgi:DNA-directed RNA polymerase subunit RPC12/RpoP
MRTMKDCAVCKGKVVAARVGKRGDLVYYRCRLCGAQTTEFEGVPYREAGGLACPECGSTGPFGEADAFPPRYSAYYTEFRRFDCSCGYWWCVEK